MGKLKELPLSDKSGWPWNEEVSSSIFEESGIVWPKISIVTPSYNQGNFIEETIRSIILQNYPNLEYIIIDGGSNDATIEIIDRYSPWIQYWVSEKDNGQSDALIKGFAKSTGLILNWINSDDILCKEGLFHIARKFIDNPKTEFVHGRNGIININSTLYSYMPHPQDNLQIRYLYEMPYGQQACFFTAEIYKKVGGINRDIQFSMDYELYLRMHLQGAKATQIDQLIGCIRTHESTKTSQMERTMYLENGNAFLTLLKNSGESTYASFLEKIGHKFYHPYVITIKLNHEILKSAYTLFLSKNIWHYYNNKNYTVSYRMAIELIKLNKKYLFNLNYLKVIKDGTKSLLQSIWTR